MKKFESQVLLTSKDVFIETYYRLKNYSSFFMIVFIVILSDQILKKLVTGVHFEYQGGFECSLFFSVMPKLFWDIMTSYQIITISLSLWAIKQAVSLWPTSDLRLIFSNRRKPGDILQSVRHLNVSIVLWDSIIDFFVIIFFMLFQMLIYGQAWLVWTIWKSCINFWIGVVVLVCVFPLLLAAISFSSNVAVMEELGWKEKTRLYFNLFADGNLKLIWWFFLFRGIAEMIFVMIIPVGILIFVDDWFFRILSASMVSAPMHAYLKASSFRLYMGLLRDDAYLSSGFSSR